MENNDNRSLMTLEQAITIAATDVQAKEWISEFAIPFKKLMAYYKCAIMEVEMTAQMSDELYQCSAVCAELDKRMELLNRKISD